MDAPAKMYVSHDPDGLWTLRQERYRSRRNHPHDICAVARTLEELRAMCEKHWPDVDYSNPDN